jgi:hypothetical protein
VVLLAAVLARLLVLIKVHAGYLPLP